MFTCLRGYKILSETLLVFFTEFKLFKISSPKFSETFRKSTAELTFL